MTNETARNARIGWLARELAKHYGADGSTRACACTGLSGTCLDCASWWDAFLKQYANDDVEAMHNAYLVIKHAVYGRCK